MGIRTTLLASAVWWGVGAAAGLAAPEADIATTQWQLDFEFHDPQRITLTLPGDAEPTTLWYVLYKVTNNTGRDVQFYPSVRLVTNTLRVVEAGADVSPSVYDAIVAGHKKEYPFLAPPAKVTGLLLQGEGNARACVAVFRMFDAEANSFTLYVSGLSGELVRVTNPVFDPDQDESEKNPRFFILRRTLAADYDLPGDPQTRRKAKAVRRSRKWVLR